VTRLTEDEIEQVGRELESVYVPHPWGDEVFRALSDLRVDGRSGNTAKGVILCGEAGVGKTHAFLAWAGQYPQVVQSPCDHRPVAFCKIVGGKGRQLSYGNVAANILAAFGDRVVAPRETIGDVISRIFRRAEEQRTKILGIDEGHLMLRSSNAAEFTKALMNHAPFALAFIGENSLLEALDGNASFERRIDEVIELKVYDWKSVAGRRALRNMLRHQRRCLPLPSDLGTYELDVAVMVSARGNIGRQTRLLRKAFANAAWRGGDRIEWRDFEIAHDRLDPRSGHRARNPFRRQHGGGLSPESRPPEGRSRDEL